MEAETTPQQRHRQRNREVLNERQKRRAAGNRRFLAEVRLTAGCIDCGFNAHVAALQFDHMGEKKFQLGSCGPRSLKAVIEEVMGCDVRCANCHMIRHAPTRRHHFRLINGG